MTKKADGKSAEIAKCVDENWTYDNAVRHQKIWNNKENYRHFAGEWCSDTAPGVAVYPVAEADTLYLYWWM